MVSNDARLASRLWQMEATRRNAIGHYLLAHQVGRGRKRLQQCG